VIGAGVNGSICAAGLSNAGINVTVLARGKRYEELRDEGIIFENLLKPLFPSSLQLPKLLPQAPCTSLFAFPPCGISPRKSRITVQSIPRRHL